MLPSLYLIVVFYSFYINIDVISKDDLELIIRLLKNHEQLTKLPILDLNA